MAKKRSTGASFDAACMEAASRANAMPLFIIVMGAWLRKGRAEAAPMLCGRLRAQHRLFLRRGPGVLLAACKTLAILFEAGVAHTPAPRALPRDWQQPRGSQAGSPGWTSTRR